MSRWSLLRTAAVIAVFIGAFAAMVVPIVRAPLVGDDLQVMAQALPELQRGSFWGLLKARVDGNINAQHYLPVAGAFEAVHVWVSVTIARVTPLSASNVWALLRVAWLLLALGAATSAAVAWRRLWPGLSHVVSAGQVLHLFATLALIGAVSLQVHGTWNHDAVLSYNAYAWPSVVLSLIYLGLTGTLLTERSHGRRLVVMTALVGSAAVLAYELSIAAAVGAGLAILLALLFSVRQGADWRSVVRRAVALSPIVVVPLVVLIVGLSLRVESTQIYAGTQVNLGVRAFYTWIFGLLSAVPFVSWPRGLGTYGEPTIASVTVLVSGLGIITMVVLALAGRRRPPPVPRDKASTPAAMWTSAPHAWTVPVAMLAAYWAVATAIHTITPKYQDEINYTLGNTYLFYAVGFVCVTLIIHRVYATLTGRLSNRSMVALAFPLVLLGLYQAAYNTQLTTTLRTTQHYSFEIVASATEDVPEPRRCAAWDNFSEQVAQNAGLVVAVADAFTEYQEQFGEPYCDSDLNTEPVFGASYREQAVGQPDFWWVTAPSAVLRVSRYPGSEASAMTFSMDFEKPPCAESRAVVVDSGARTERIELSGDRPASSAEFVLPPGVSSADISVTTTGPPCQVGEDPRQLLVMTEAAVITGEAR